MMGVFFAGFLGAVLGLFALVVMALAGSLSQEANDFAFQNREAERRQKATTSGWLFILALFLWLCSVGCFLL